MTQADSEREKTAPFRLGGWTVEPLCNRLRKGDRVVALEPKVMRLLVSLSRRDGEVATRETLLAEVWDGLNVVDGVMGRAVYQLRRRLAECDGCGADVETIRQVGYRLVRDEAAPVRRARRWFRLAGHPLLAWGTTVAAACAALIVILHPPTPETRVRFVAVEVPAEAVPSPVAAASVERPVPVRRVVRPVPAAAPIVETSSRPTPTYAPAAPSAGPVYRTIGVSMPAPPLPPPPPPAPPPPPPPPPPAPPAPPPPPPTPPMIVS